jgi:hypothetical protein
MLQVQCTHCHHGHPVAFSLAIANLVGVISMISLCFPSLREDETELTDLSQQRACVEALAPGHACLMRHQPADKCPRRLLSVIKKVAMMMC